MTKTNTKTYGKDPLIGHQKSYHLMLLPAVLLILIFQYFPLYGIVIAFKNYSVFRGIQNSPWAAQNGFEHFIDFFQSPRALEVLRNTISIALLKLIITMFPPVIFAILLNEISHRIFKRTIQTITFLPHFLSWIVLGGIFMNFFLPSSNAPFNKILLSLGLVDTPTDIINNPKAIWWVFVIGDLWKSIGWNSIIYLAVIVSIDPNLYEAIEIDGGGRLAKMIHISWPALKGTFVILFIMACGKIMSSGNETFDQSYVFLTSGNKSMAQVLDVYIIRIGLEQGRFSFATAVGFFKSVVNLILLMSANTISRRISGKGLF